MARNEQTKEDKGDFTRGKVSAVVLKLAVPLFFAQVVNVLYSIVDRIYIGHMQGDGTQALTGIGVAAPIIMLVTAFTNMCGAGGAPIFSMSRGQGDDEKAADLLGNVTALLMIFGTLVMIVVYLIRRPMLYFFGASDATFEYADTYLSIYLLGTYFVMLSTGLNPYINSQGFGTVGMLTVVIGAATNLVLDPLFIFLLDMRTAGAAVATVISQVVSAAWAVHFLAGRKVPVRLQIRRMKLKPQLVKRILSLGITPFIMSFTTSLTLVVFNIGLKKYGGDIYVTAMTVISSLRDIFLMAMHGITNGAQPVIGYNYGAKQYDRAKQAIDFMMVFSLIYSVANWLFLMFFPAAVIRLFNNDPALLAVGPHCIRVFYCMLWAISFQSIGQNTFMALGMSRHAMVFSLFRKVVLVLPLALILPLLMKAPADGVLLSEAVSEVIGGAASFTCMYVTVYRNLKKGRPIPALQ